MSEKKKKLFLFKMARLVSYKPKDENRYSTFRNESTVNPSIRYKESDLFKRVEVVKKTRNIKSKKSACLRCFTLKFWYSVCLCCCCCRCTKKKCGYCCCYSPDYEGDTIEDGIDIKTISCISSDIQMSEINVNNFNSEKAKSKASKKLSTKYWNWNDSLRSNSDRFLETLEYDLDGDRSLKKKSNRTSSKIPLYCQGKGFCYFILFLLATQKRHVANITRPRCQFKCQPDTFIYNFMNIRTSKTVNLLF